LPVQLPMFFEKWVLDFFSINPLREKNEDRCNFEGIEWWRQLILWNNAFSARSLEQFLDNLNQGFMFPSISVFPKTNFPTNSEDFSWGYAPVFPVIH
jgi:hypothetical protein